MNIYRLNSNISWYVQPSIDIWESDGKCGNSYVFFWMQMKWIKYKDDESVIWFSWKYNEHLIDTMYTFDLNLNCDDILHTFRSRFLLLSFSLVHFSNICLLTYAQTHVYIYIQMPSRLNWGSRAEYMSRQMVIQWHEFCVLSRFAFPKTQFEFSE